MGNPHHAPLGVYLSYQAAMFIEAYLQANPVNEMAGFLVGQAFHGEKRPFIMITGAIEARDVVQVDGGLRFSQETWTYLKNVWQREYADTVVLGWFHSQPGKGLALSDINSLTHQQFFERPWQVSFVVDPLQNTSRFYRRAGRKLVPLEDFYLFDPNENAPQLAHQVEPALAEQESAAATEHAMPPPVVAAPPQRTFHWHGLGIVLLLSIVLVFSLTVHRVVWHFSPSLNEAAAQLSSIEAQLVEAHSEQQRLEELLQQLKRAETNTPGSMATLPPDQDVPQPNTVEAHRAGAADGGGVGTDENFRLYVVQPGDTLWKISENVFGTPYAYTRLAELNQLADPDRILSGMVLRLPPADAE